ncbi:hypothetical protein [Yinghuangia soli]|uniref:Mycothiol-dependent maleylpyruvate isomerase metal-binding domain-containing protein n=1 Tax=Yinghuangia soli TaxID=2908204 RepID=A0AA41PX86_9ACTN|nr:hypothetical protein [Yinghuangia soli]MCF2527524.1 hypothetical protein [Yinghuangia soli]
MAEIPVPPIPSTSRTPVSAADVEYAVALAVAAFRGAPADASWQAKAGGLEWDCWETGEHLADDLFIYAALLAPAVTAPGRFGPYQASAGRPGGPENTLFLDRDSGPEGMYEGLEAMAAYLAAMVATRPNGPRAFGGYGLTDAEGFAAMGVAETLLHAHDIGAGLGVGFTPPADLCDRTLGRLFPDAPAGTQRWQTLLWATGRAELPGHPSRKDGWTWHSAPLAAETAHPVPTAEEEEDPQRG